MTRHYTIAKTKTKATIYIFFYIALKQTIMCQNLKMGKLSQAWKGKAVQYRYYRDLKNHGNFIKHLLMKKLC